jgi:hypothetical protein
MHPIKVTLLGQIGTQALIKFVHHLIWIALELLGAVLGELGDRGLRRVPVAWPVLVEVCGRCCKPP